MTTDPPQGPWLRDQADIFGASAARGPFLVCRVNRELPDWRSHAVLIAAAPDLYEAVRASQAALEEVAPLLPADSKADLLAVRALGLVIRVVSDIEAALGDGPIEEG